MPGPLETKAHKCLINISIHSFIHKMLIELLLDVRPCAGNEQGMIHTTIYKISKKQGPTQTGLGHLYLTSPLASGMAGSRGSKVSRLISLYLFTVELYIGMVLLRCGTFTSSSSITSCSLLKPAGACCSISLAVPLT